MLYGDALIEELCDRFLLLKDPVVRAFREFKDSGGRNIPNDLKILSRVIDSLVISTSDCERGFSQMNNIMDPSRSLLSIEHLCSLLVVKCLGPPLKFFKPEKYVRSWFLKGHVSADDSKARSVNESSNEQEELRELWNIV